MPHRSSSAVTPVAPVDPADRLLALIAVFAVATSRKPLADPVPGLTALGAAAANCLARAVARAVYEATALPHAGALPAWRDRFGRES